MTCMQLGHETRTLASVCAEFWATNTDRRQWQLWSWTLPRNLTPNWAGTKALEDDILNATVLILCLGACPSVPATAVVPATAAIAITPAKTSQNPGKWLPAQQEKHSETENSHKPTIRETVSTHSRGFPEPQNYWKNTPEGSADNSLVDGWDSLYSQQIRAPNERDDRMSRFLGFAPFCAGASREVDGWKRPTSVMLGDVVWRLPKFRRRRRLCG